MKKSRPAATVREPSSSDARSSSDVHVGVSTKACPSPVRTQLRVHVLSSNPSKPKTENRERSERVKPYPENRERSERIHTEVLNTRIPKCFKQLGHELIYCATASCRAPI